MDESFVVGESEVGDALVAESDDRLQRLAHHPLVIEVDLVPVRVPRLVATLDQKWDPARLQKLSLLLGVLFPAPKDHRFARPRPR